MKWIVALVASLAFTVAPGARNIRSGATMQVKAGAIWFTDKAALARWQPLKSAGDAKAFASYQDGYCTGAMRGSLSGQSKCEFADIDPRRIRSTWR